MTAPCILGIDIGAAGALALITPNGDLIEISDMPVLRDGPKNRATVNAALLAKLIYDSHAAEAFVEHVSATPGEGAVGAFAFGRSRGVVEGVLARFARVKDDGRAEAALIAIAGLARKRQGGAK